MGGPNRGCGYGEDALLQDSNFARTYDDAFDNTYGTYVFRVPAQWMHHHEGIVSRDDFIAVQRMLANAKYGNKTLLPELSVIHEGIFKGFVTINPRWAGFKASDYYQAARSAYTVASDGQQSATNSAISSGFQIKVRPGDFDLRGFEIARTEFFDTTLRPFVTMRDRIINQTYNRTDSNSWCKCFYSLFALGFWQVVCAKDFALASWDLEIFLFKDFFPFIEKSHRAILTDRTLHRNEQPWFSLRLSFTN